MPRLPKQLIWSVLLWLIVGLNAWAVDELTITVIPESPTTNDRVNIVITDLDRLQDEGALHTILSEHSLDENIVKITISIGIGFGGVPLPAITNINTNLGALPTGTYEIELYLINRGREVNTLRLIQKSSFLVSGNTHSIPSLSGIGATLLSLTIAFLGGLYRLRQKRVNAHSPRLSTSRIKV